MERNKTQTTMIDTEKVFKQNILRNIFKDNHDCVADWAKSGIKTDKDINIPAMTEETFVEVVLNLLDHIGEDIQKTKGNKNG